MASPAVPLSMLLTKDVPYEWHDGVALVAQLLSQLASPADPQALSAVPDLRSIQLEETGWLAISRLPDETLPAMPGAAQLLQQLLSGRDQPPQLRLFAMQAATADPPNALATFADELAKWERPNRVPKLVALYARAVDAIGPAALTAEAMAREERASNRRPRGDDKAAKPAAARRQSASMRTVVIGGLIVAAALGVAALEWRYVLARFAPGPSVRLDLEAEAPPETETPVVAAPKPRPPAAPNRAGGPGPATAAGASTPVPPEAVTPMSPAVAVAEEEMARGQELFAQQEYAKTREALERVLESLRSEQSTRAGEIRQAARDLREVTQAATEDAAVTAGLEFRSGDPGVVPPVPQAHLPPKPSPRTPPNTLQVMEIRINADGRVDSAKFVINRPSFRNSWWTAAAKAWRFTPATKDGRPVRYVMRIVMDDADGVR